MTTIRGMWTWRCGARFSAVHAIRPRPAEVGLANFRALVLFGDEGYPLSEAGRCTVPHAAGLTRGGLWRFVMESGVAYVGATSPDLPVHAVASIYGRGVALLCRPDKMVVEVAFALDMETAVCSAEPCLTSEATAERIRAVDTPVSWDFRGVGASSMTERDGS